MSRRELLPLRRSSKFRAPALIFSTACPSLWLSCFRRLRLLPSALAELTQGSFSSSSVDACSELTKACFVWGVGSPECLSAAPGGASSSPPAVKFWSAGVSRGLGVRAVGDACSPPCTPTVGISPLSAPLSMGGGPRRDALDSDPPPPSLESSSKRIDLDRSVGGLATMPSSSCSPSL